MKSSKALFLILSLTVAAALPATGSYEKNSVALNQTRAEVKDLGEQVRQAFEALRKGNYQPVSALKNSGEAIIPHLKPYQNDADPRLRTQVIWFLKHTVSKSSVPLLAKALLDADKNVSADAARTLFEFYDASLFENDGETGANLRKSVAAGNDSTAALLLLGYFPAPETVQILSVISKSSKNNINGSFMQFPMVSPKIASRVSLSRIGNQEANSVLIETIKIGSQNDLEFLLRAVKFINERKVLNVLFQKTIADEREIQTVFDGKYKGKNLLSRMNDLAVNAFGEKLELDFNFKIEKNKRYKKAEIDEAKRKITAALAEK